MHNIQGVDPFTIRGQNLWSLRGGLDNYAIALTNNAALEKLDAQRQGKLRPLTAAATELNNQSTI